MNKYAFFDVDNTIYNGYTASDFILYGIQKGIISTKIKEELENAFRRYTIREIDYTEISQICLDLFSKSVKGWTKTKGRRLIAGMLKGKEKLFNDWVFEVVDFFKDKRYKIVLVSAGPEPVIQALNECIYTDMILATKIDTKKGKYTGKSPILLNNKYKVDKIREIVGSDSNTFSIGFGDSPGDFDMLSLMDKAFVVRNDHHPEMMEIAKEKGWVLFKSEEEVLKHLVNSRS